MQSLEIISLNIWQILISLLNLLILFLVIKKFLFKPVRRVMDARKQAIDAKYTDAEAALQQASEEKEAYDEKMKHADEEADQRIKDALLIADRRSAEILEQSREKADGILRAADAEAEQRIAQAQSSIRQQIVDVSTELTEKMLEREIKPADHRELFDSFLREIGTEDEGNK